MNYDTMTAHEILVMAVTTAYQEDYLPVIESALRRAFIREASVGKITFDSAFLEPIYDASLGLDGDYDLIPKEAP